MTDLPDNRSAIAKPDLFEAFRRQLKKDFENCGLDGGFTESLAADYDLLLAAIEEQVKKIMAQSGNKLSELLYRIDISEAQLKKLGHEKKDTAFSGIVAELIVKRILQKVVLKELYRNK